MNRPALVVSCLAVWAASAAPFMTEVSVGVDSQPHDDEDDLQSFGEAAAVSLHWTLVEHLSLGFDAGWSHHDAPQVFSDCFGCVFVASADFVRTGPSVRWWTDVGDLELYLQAGPQLSVGFVHTTGGIAPRDPGRIAAGVAGDLRAGALVWIKRWIAVGASAEGYVGTAGIGGLGGTGSMIVALRL